MQAKWPRWVLRSAAVYNLVWGLWVVLFPNAWFEWLGVTTPNYPQLWQCIGMIVGVYGIGYGIAASDPARHWPIVLVGLLGKIFGPIGFLSAAWNGELPWSWGWLILTNDLIWWIPFVGILVESLKEKSNPVGVEKGRDELLHEMFSQRGATLAQLSYRRPILLVFLRHSGCVFCREALDDLANSRGSIEGEGAEIAVVHMSSPIRATQLLAQYGLDDLHRFSDPSCMLYRAFKLSRGTLRQLLGLNVWFRGMALFMHGHSFGLMDGDGFQLPGAFVLVQGRVVRSFYHQTAADRPDYLGMVQSAMEEERERATSVLQPSTAGR